LALTDPRTVAKKGDCDLGGLSEGGVVGYRCRTSSLRPDDFVLMGRLKLQSNGPLYSNTVVGTLAVDVWPVTYGTARRGLGGWGPAQAPPRCGTIIAS